MQLQIVRQFLKDVISQTNVTAPNFSHINPAWREPLTILHAINREHGPQETARQWHDFLKAAYPDLAKVVAPRRLYHVDELDQLPQPSWLIDNVLPNHGLSVLFGPSGAGKSFIALDWAFRVARSRVVLYLAAEGKAGFPARTQAWKQHHELNKPAHLSFYFDAVNFLNPEALEAFIAEISPMKPSLIIVDTLARCMVGGDENSSKDMGRFAEACAEIERQIGAAILVVHHTGKDLSKGPRGSSALYGAVDMMIKLTNNDGLIRVKCVKSKDSEPFNSQFFRLKKVHLDNGLSSCVPVLTKQVVDTPAKSKLAVQQRQILEVLALPEFAENGARPRDILEKTEIPQTSLFRTLKALVEFGYACQESKSSPYKLTKAGKSMLLKAPIEVNFQPENAIA